MPEVEAIPGSGGGDTRSPAILLVEDESLIRWALADYLRDCGFRVLEASNGDVAMALITKCGASIAVVFSDVVMPGSMSGFDLAQWMSTNHPAIKVILTSGYSGAVPRGADLFDMIPKPYDYAEIRRRVGLALREAQPSFGYGRENAEWALSSRARGITPSGSLMHDAGTDVLGGCATEIRVDCDMLLACVRKQRVVGQFACQQTQQL